MYVCLPRVDAAMDQNCDPSLNAAEWRRIGTEGLHVAARLDCAE